MNSFFEAHNQWQLGENKRALDTLTTSLSLLVGEDETFFIDEELFFEKKYLTFSSFVHNLLRNENRKESFSIVFSKLLELVPINEVIYILLTKDFSEPGMCEFLGMDQLGLGFNDPEEDVELILQVIKTTIETGYLTLSRPQPVICNKIHLDYNFIEEKEESQWKELKPLLLKERKNLESIPEKGWLEMAESDCEFFLSSFLYDYFGSSVREEKENCHILGQCLLADVKWKKAIQIASEKCLVQLKSDELKKIIEATTLIRGIDSQEWINKLLDFTVDSSENKYEILF